MRMMQNVIDRPQAMAHGNSQDDTLSREALWVIEALAQELADNAKADRRALVEGLRRKAGYEQADSLWPDRNDALRAKLVARLAERLD